jgi:hypothetical protein
MTTKAPPVQPGKYDETRSHVLSKTKYNLFFCLSKSLEYKLRKTCAVFLISFLPCAVFQVFVMFSN